MDFDKEMDKDFKYAVIAGVAVFIALLIFVGLAELGYLNVLYSLTK